MTKTKVHLFLDTEELQKFRANAKERYSNLSREVNIFMKEYNKKVEEVSHD